MIRAALLAFALLLSPALPAQSAPPAGAAASPSACSDYERHFPRCGIAKDIDKKARREYEHAARLVREHHLEEALQLLAEVRRLSPHDSVYAAAESAVKEKLSAESLRQGNQALGRGNAEEALSSFRRASELAPDNGYALQRLHDALPAPPSEGGAALLPSMTETRLRPAAVRRSFEFRGNSSGLLQELGRAYGVNIVPELTLQPRPIRMKLENVDWATASAIVSRLAKVLLIPTGELQVLAVNDTDENRRDLTQMTLRTFYAQGGSTAQQLTELSTALRVLFDLKFITPNVAQSAIVVRAPQATMDAINAFLEGFEQAPQGVMLEIKVFQLSSTFDRELGITPPNEFNIFNVPTEVNNLLTSSQYQEIVTALTAAGQPVNATTILAALLASSSASSSSSVLSQPFGTFGGGLTLTGVTIPQTALKALGANSLARTLDEVTLRAGHGQAATLKVGERYPIVSSTFAATSATSSLLSSLGITTSSSSAVPSPQFSYEDIGLTFKATPQVHGDLVSLDYEMTMRALGATQSNGLPLLTNREMKGSISTNDGEPVVIAGSVDQDEIASLNGFPLLSAIPGLGNAFSSTSKQKASDELLVVITPHLTSKRAAQGSWVAVPTGMPR